jgi:poly-gamma-glutamate capsule biosynthesis protein CapA/YwtB (metallophosphatase superfamily)
MISKGLISLIVLVLILLTSCAAQPAIGAASGQQDIDLKVGTAPVTPIPSPTTPASPSPSVSSQLPTTLAPALSSTPAPELPSSRTPQPTTTLLFTGVIVPARCVQAAIDEKGDSDYPYAEVSEVISAADLAVGTLNATISDYPAHTGCTSTYLLVGGSENADALARAGFDVMSVATNHIKNCGPTNCGDRAFFDTLDNLRRVGIVPVGAGENLAAAMQPVEMTLNGVRFGIVSLGQIEAQTFASEGSPGIAVLDEDNLRAAIAAARQVSDVVIAMPHWGPEDVPVPNWIQRGLARVAVEAGADLVVGNHTHVVQAVEEIDGVMVFYGLGNFVFDQNWSLEHMQGVILEVTFEGERYAGYQFIPTHVDWDGRVHLAGEVEAADILARIQEVSASLALYPTGSPAP